MIPWNKSWQNALCNFKLNPEMPWEVAEQKWRQEDARCVWTKISSHFLVADMIYCKLFFCFSDTEQDMNGMASDDNTSSQEEFLPHYLQKEDPFASKLSREADIVAGIYLTIIGNDFLVCLWNMTMSLHLCRHSWRRQKLWCIRCVIIYFSILERKLYKGEDSMC